MSILNYAVASLVDAHTGYGLNRQYIDQYGSNYSSHEKQAREIRSRPFLDFIGKIKTSVQNYIEDSKAEARNSQATKDLFQLNDRLLRDIGLTKDDLYELDIGSIDLDTLNARRNQIDIPANRYGDTGTVSNRLVNQGSANQDEFETKKCA